MEPAAPPWTVLSWGRPDAGEIRSHAYSVEATHPTTSVERPSPYWMVSCTQHAEGPGPGWVRRHWREVTSGVLAVTAVVCLFFGNAALWMREDLYSSRNLDQDAQQILGSTQVQSAVADLLTKQVVHVALAGSGLGPFAAVIQTPAIGVADRLVSQALASQPVQHVEARLLEVVIPEMKSGAGPISLSPDQLVWIASPSFATNRVMASVVHTADRTGCCQVELAQRHKLSFAWRYVHQIRIAGIVLPALFVAMTGLALLITPRRKQLALTVAVATAATGLITLGLLTAHPGFWAGLISTSGPGAVVLRAADRAAFNTATAALRVHSLVLTAVGACTIAGLASTKWTRFSRRSVPSQAQQ
jgi:hypothetical protein